MYKSKYTSPIGEILIIGSETKILFSRFKKNDIEGKEKVNFKETGVIKEAKKFLDEYFLKKRWRIFENITLEMTPKKYHEILKKVMEIPFGETKFYSDLGNGRFVGICLKNNPLHIFIPCHRVISKNSIGGYTPKIEIKKFLLKHEEIIK